MSVEFYKKFWSIVGDDVTNMALNILNNESSISVINKTNIVLIPKKNKHVNPVNFRPISLFNMVYKIVSKALVKKLKPWLSGLIDLSQSTFVTGRSIFNNVITAYEITHSMHTKRTGSVGFVGAKLDMSKAYDRVDWSYVIKIMSSMD